MTPASDDFRAAWQRLPRRNRTALMRAALRGQRGGSRRDAGLMLWWSQEELRRGAWPAIRLALAVVVAVVVVQALVQGGQVRGLDAVLGAAPLLPVILLIPAAAWTLRRPRLQRSAQLNAGVLAGRSVTKPPDPAETERLLKRARKDLAGGSVSR